jgi:predicted nucleic acid-binding protein
LTVYADSSFFVSIYMQDAHTVAARQLIKSHLRLWFTPLHYAEWTHAVTQHVFHGKMSAAESQRVHQALEQDRADALWVEVGMPEQGFEVCADLARQHGAHLGVRTLDSLHVACALQLKAERFWTFDRRQAKLAKAVGLKSSGL